MSKRVIEMLNNHIEFAEKTSKLHDVGNFELIKATIEKQVKEIEELKDQNNELIKAIKYSTDYLEQSKLNSIGSTSKAHIELQCALTNAGV